MISMPLRPSIITEFRHLLDWRFALHTQKYPGHIQQTSENIVCSLGLFTPLSIQLDQYNVKNLENSMIINNLYT